MSTTISRSIPANELMSFVRKEKNKIEIRIFYCLLHTHFAHETTAASDKNGFSFVELLHRCQLIRITHFTIRKEECEKKKQTN